VTLPVLQLPRRASGARVELGAALGALPEGDARRWQVLLEASAASGLAAGLDAARPRFPALYRLARVQRRMSYEKSVDKDWAEF